MTTPATSTVARWTMVVVAIVGGAMLLWTSRSLFLLLFAATLFAVMFHAAAAWIAQKTRLPHGISLAIAVITLLSVIGLIIWLFGNAMTAQTQELIARLPSAYDDFKTRVGQPDLEVRLLRELAPNSATILAATRDMLSGVGTALSGLVLAIVGGVYLAAQSSRYVEGLILLSPVNMRDRFTEVMRASGVALRRWLIGQLVSMVLVGLLAGVGVWLLGLPSPLALGLMAGLFEFVPFVGPLAAAIPAILLAVALGWQKVLLVIGLYLLVQQLEGNLITPLVQQRAVNLPPALTLFSVVAFGLLFGVLGVLLAAPLTVLLYVWIKALQLPAKPAE